MIQAKGELKRKEQQSDFVINCSFLCCNRPLFEHRTDANHSQRVCACVCVCMPVCAQTILLKYGTTAHK